MKPTPQLRIIAGLVVAVPVALVLALTAYALAQDPAGEYRLDAPMVSHLQAGMNEQDVFLVRDGGAFRVTAADEDAYAPLYAAAEGAAHNPASPDDVGPFEAGQALGFSQGEWLAGQGGLSLSCEQGQGAVTASFENLVPNATYTVWQSYVVTPPTVPLKVIDIPLGALDGSQNVFGSDENGNALFSTELDACVPLSEDYLATVIAIAYHSDGQTHGLEPGDFGKTSHVHLLTFLPTRAQLEAQVGH